MLCPFIGFQPALFTGGEPLLVIVTGSPVMSRAVIVTVPARPPQAKERMPMTLYHLHEEPMIQLLVGSLIKSMIWRKALILVGVTLLAMTGIGLIVLLLFFLGKRMMTMMAGDGRCSCMGPGERRYHE